MADFEINGLPINAGVSRQSGEIGIKQEKGDATASLRALGHGEYLLDIDGMIKRIWMVSEGDDVFIHMDGRSWAVRKVEKLAASASGGEQGGEDTVRSPMPGTVIGLNVKEGDLVHMGQTLMVIESMKMETPINARRDGTIEKMHLAVGATFNRDAQMVTLAKVTTVSTEAEAEDSGES